MAGRGASERGTRNAALLKDLQRQVKLLEADLRRRAEEPGSAAVLTSEWQSARDANRIAATYGAWLGEQVTQAAVAWVLSCVFLRFAEDNELIEQPYLAGPGNRLGDAEDRQEAFFRASPTSNDRDWIVEGFRQLAEAAPAARGLFDERHNPLWRLTPSYDAATSLLKFWRQRDDLGMDIQYSFRDETLDTRFLGDLYQDLSEAARKQYALLQTPEFVEEFILDLTLTPALSADEGFGLSPDFRLIDPTCGSGHFLLGAFHRLLAAWRAADTGEDDFTLIRYALRSVNGVDKNPFAAAIARFRLLIAAMQAAGKTTFAQIRQYELPIRVAVADSLWHFGWMHQQQDLFSLAEVGAAVDHPFAYASEDMYEPQYLGILEENSYHVVVGNPPYITVKDKAENEAYRRLYPTCSGKYALSVPFAELFFALAVRPQDSRLRRGGFVGKITSNSFMKREFGKKLIEQFFRSEVDLTHILDTAGAYIPGHGTPTVILVGRNRTAYIKAPILAVLGVRGEPGVPKDPAKGHVWSAIVEQVRLPGTPSEWVTGEVVEHDGRFASHPWSIAGGGAGELFESIAGDRSRLAAVAESIGITSFTLEDDVFLLAPETANRYRIGSDWLRQMVTGDAIRDWREGQFDSAIFPYDPNFEAVDVEDSQQVFEYMWPYRATLAKNMLFGGKTKVEGGLKWSEYGRLTASKLRTPLSITFGEVSTHNHFALDRGGKVFKQTAPVIKLSETADEDDHLALLGALNSSLACFWLKQVSQDKGIRGEGGGFTSDGWERFYQFGSTKVGTLPLPVTLPLDLSRKLDALAAQIVRHEPLAICQQALPNRDRLDDARVAQSTHRAQMIAWQEELDWNIYHLYGLLTDDEAAAVIADSADVPTEGIALGERAFEIVLGREIEDGTTKTQWFARHGARHRITRPADWPERYREVVDARIHLIQQRPDLALMERPDCKRRWLSDSWEVKEEAALRRWLLDHCENEAFWFTIEDGFRQPRPLTVNRLADFLDQDSDVVQVADIYKRDHLKKPGLSLGRVLEQIIADEHVPYLAVLRYKPAGLAKRKDWEATWDQQREEDRTGRDLDIAVPPKYVPTDFAKPSYWRNRGKLDVPKERFISYPGASPDSDPTLLLGWAGWDHLDQARATVSIIDAREQEASWGPERLTGLVAGLREQMPWVRQWHGEYDAAWSGSPADELDTYLNDKRTAFGLSDQALEEYRP